jgi:cytochrome b
VDRIIMTAIPSQQAAPAPADRIRVWDLPTRIFHWALAGFLLVSWLTGEAEGAGLFHRLSGEIIAGLVVFRVIWGLVGGEHARFANFLRGPRAAASHLGHLLRGRAEPTLGHNALGGLSVLLLLASVSMVVVTGLFSAGDEGPGGPLAGRFGWDLSGLHEPAFRVLQGVVALHLLGVLVTSIVGRDNLAAAMITGSKRRRADATSARACATGVDGGAAGRRGAGRVSFGLPHELAAPQRRRRRGADPEPRRRRQG